MGALATVDFLQKLVMATPATCDQKHIPLLVRFCPEVPDRVNALLGLGPSPEPALIAAALTLERGGAQCLVMPCNTAHAWHDAMAKAVSIPLLHIVDAALMAACQLGNLMRSDCWPLPGLCAALSTRPVLAVMSGGSCPSTTSRSSG
ncbi:MAG: aspartate/glutamate racemase family protein [Rhodoferax sp.]